MISFGATCNIFFVKVDKFQEAIWVRWNKFGILWIVTETSDIKSNFGWIINIWFMSIDCTTSHEIRNNVYLFSNIGNLQIFNSSQGFIKRSLTLPLNLLLVLLWAPSIVYQQVWVFQLRWHLPCLQILVKQEVKQCYFHSSVIACKPLLISDYHLSQFRWQVANPPSLWLIICQGKYFRYSRWGEVSSPYSCLSTPRPMMSLALPFNAIYWPQIQSFV